MPAAGLTLTAVHKPSALDARRGVVRVHPDVLTALGARPWDPLLLHGGRATAALAAFAPPASDRAQLLCDDLVLDNLRVTSGAPVRIELAIAAPAGVVELSGPAEVVAAVEPEMLRFALLGKVVTAGDAVSLLPQDLSLPPGAPAGPLDAARRSIANRVGPAWTTTLLTVVEAIPAGAAVVTMSTVVGWQRGAATTGSATPVGTADAAGLDRLPGLEGPAATLREWLELGFHGGELLRRLGTSLRLGIMLSGPAGSGKGALVEAVAAVVGARVVRLWGPTVAALAPSEAATALGRALEDAKRGAPAVVLLEDIEALAAREEPGAHQSMLVQALRTALSEPGLAVVCTTGRPEQVSPLLRRPGLLDHELRVPLPDRATRARILGVLTRGMPLASEIRLDDVAARTGFRRRRSAGADSRGRVAGGASPAGQHRTRTPRRSAGGGRASRGRAGGGRAGGGRGGGQGGHRRGPGGGTPDRDGRDLTGAG